MVAVRNMLYLRQDEPEADCPLEESFMWVQEPDGPPPSDEQGEERMKTAEEERAEQALVAAEKQQEKKDAQRAGQTGCENITESSYNVYALT